MLLDIAVCMFCMSLLATAYVGFAMWLFRLLCFIFQRSTTEPDIFTVLRVINFAPTVFVGVATLELAAYIWWWLLGLLGRRHRDQFFGFPVYGILRLIFNAYDAALDSLFPVRTRWGGRRGHASVI